MTLQKRPDQWVRYNPLTDTYDTPDGTHVPAFFVDTIQSPSDVFQIATIREKQRQDLRGLWDQEQT